METSNVNNKSKVNELIIVCLVIFCALIIAVVILNYSQNSNEEKKVVTTEDVSTDHPSLIKVRDIIQNNKTNGSKYSFSIEDYGNFLSIYSYQGKNLAVVHDNNDPTATSSLYFIDENNQASLLFKGLLNDCCGGGMPIVRGVESGNPIIGVVSSGSGDVCGSLGQELYVNLDRPDDFLLVNLSASHCFGTKYNLNIYNKKIGKIELKPVVSGKCQDKDTILSLTGVEAVKDSIVIAKKNFVKPVSLSCVFSEDIKEYHIQEGLIFKTLGPDLDMKSLEFELSVKSNIEDSKYSSILTTIPLQYNYETNYEASSFR